MKQSKKFFKQFKIKRTTVLSILCLCMACGLIYRIFSLQIIHGKEYADNFSIQNTKERTLKSTRGNIFDRNGNVLASNQLSYSVTLEDNGTYKNSREKNLLLNGTIYQIIKIIEENGDSIAKDFHIILDENGEYQYDVTGFSLSRFKADIYGKASIDDMSKAQASASAQNIIDHLTDEFGFYHEKEPYTKKELLKAGLPAELSKEEILKIISVRYNLFTTSFRKYLPVTIATNVNENTVASILENQNHLQGVDILEDSIRVYTDAEYFASLIGYTGKISSEELSELDKENPENDYSTRSIIGKSGIEKVMETSLQGKEGSETVYVDSMGKVLEIDKNSIVSPVQGNDVYLTIDKELQIACYKILEQQIAAIVHNNIQNIKSFKLSPGMNGSNLPIPIYDVYFALVNNSVLDISHFDDEDASPTEQEVQQKFQQKQEEIFAKIEAELTGSNPALYKDLSEEMQGYISYIVNELLMKKTDILSATAIDKNDEIYKKWSAEGDISLREYLTYAASQNWIDVSRVSNKDTYLDSAEIYQELSKYISDYLKNDTDFGKMLYKYLLLDDEISGKDLCIILYDQGILSKDDGMYEKLVNGNLTPMEFMKTKILNLEITPAQLALEPCSGSMVIVNPNNGETLACVSYPGYDNNRLANQMDSDYFRRLSKDLSKPFYNKATQERTAPGSTFKPITAVAGLMEGVIDDSSSINCTGVFDKIQASELNCWLLTGHGSLNIRDAIKNSCNVFFSETAYRMGQNEKQEYKDSVALEKLINYSKLFNMDKKSGLEIPETSPQVTDQLPIPSSIGQGTHNYTTSQLARYVASIANSGTSYNISLIDKTTDSDGNLVEDYTPEVLSTIDIPQWIWDDVHAGMEGVIQTPGNQQVFGGMQVTLAGKTGTAQWAKNKPNHGVFVGYAPASQPEIAFATRIANGYSSINAEWVAKNMLDYYFNLKEETDILTGQANSGVVTSNGRTD